MSLALLFICFPYAQAKDLCEEYKNSAPLPTWFSEYCTSEGKLKSKIGGAYSSIGDAFNLNPAAIPTGKVPLGVEYIGSLNGTDRKSSFAFIKGFGHVGTALTTNSDETFYGSSVFQTPGSASTSSVAGATQSGANAFDRSLFPTLNLGSAVDLSSFFKDKLRSIFDLASSLGVMMKYNKNTGGFTPGFGIGFEVWKFSAGYSYTTDPAYGSSPKVTYSTVTLGLKTPIFQVEGVVIQYQTVPTYSSVQQTTGSYHYQSTGHTSRYAAFVTLSSTVGRFMFSGAIRSYDDVYQIHHLEYHYGAEFLVTPKFSIEYLNNYVVDRQSLGVQVLF